ncbi:hypothetical protein ACH79_37385 [Bradyrhizobium sp. CCBAU 051011]|nr:hypothetical protein ACH79_37385 [Bradyrhizobium sp. CCBAU 051011]
MFAPSRLMKRGVRVVTIRGVRGAMDAKALARARHCRAAFTAVSDRSQRRTSGAFRVRQKRVVLAPVAGVKPAEVLQDPTGFSNPSIRRRWRQEEFVSRESAP